MARDFITKMTTDKKRAWSQAQTYLALGNALNGAKALGFDSCPRGGVDPEEYTRILRIPPGVVPVIVCPVGYAADTPLPMIRVPAKRYPLLNLLLLLIRQQGKSVGESQVLMATKT